jgi:23S rRNA pseudouridine2457 synthase
MPQYSYFVIYKPYQVMSQFSPSGEKKTLKDFFDVPKDVYPVGRLDFDSEGLLILTNDTTLNQQLLHPKNEHEREYWAQVDFDVLPASIQQIENGVAINIDGKMYQTKPCKASVISPEPLVPQRFPPIRFRKEIPTTWLKLILKEGKNRQVRKMTAAIGHPTLRLIRNRIEQLKLGNMQPGEMIELDESTIKKLLLKNGK